jgi:hypothetical protein
MGWGRVDGSWVPYANEGGYWLLSFFSSGSEESGDEAELGIG